MIHNIQNNRFFCRIDKLPLQILYIIFHVCIKCNELYHNAPINSYFDNIFFDWTGISVNINNMISQCTNNSTSLRIFLLFQE